MSSESLMDSDLDGGSRPGSHQPVIRTSSSESSCRPPHFATEPKASRSSPATQPVWTRSGKPRHRRSVGVSRRAPTPERSEDGGGNGLTPSGCRPALCTTCSTSTTSPAAPTATGSILRRLESEGLLTGVVRWVKTPSGGVHAYFPANSDPMQAMVNAQYAHAGVDLVLKNRCRAASSLVFKPRGLGVQVSLLRYGQPRSRPRRGGSTARV
jgi:hypothetical protein